MCINRGDHDFVSDHELVLDLCCHGIFRVFESQRLEVHIIVQSSFHVFAVEVWQQAVTYSDYMTEVLDVLKLIAFLFPCTKSCVVAHKWGEHSKCQPAEHRSLVVSEPNPPRSAPV